MEVIIHERIQVKSRSKPSSWYLLLFRLTISLIIAAIVCQRTGVCMILKIKEASYLMFVVRFFHSNPATAFAVGRSIAAGAECLQVLAKTIRLAALAVVLCGIRRVSSDHKDGPCSAPQRRPHFFPIPNSVWQKSRTQCMHFSLEWSSFKKVGLGPRRIA